MRLDADLGEALIRKTHRLDLEAAALLDLSKTLIAAGNVESAEDLAESASAIAIEIDSALLRSAAWVQRAYVAEKRSDGADARLALARARSALDEGPREVAFDWVAVFRERAEIEDSIRDLQNRLAE